MNLLAQTSTFGVWHVSQHTLLGGHHGRPLQQPGVQVEHISGVGLTTGRSAQQEGDLAVGDGLLGQIVVHQQNVPRTAAEFVGLLGVTQGVGPANETKKCVYSFLNPPTSPLSSRILIGKKESANLHFFLLPLRVCTGCFFLLVVD